MDGFASFLSFFLFGLQGGSWGWKDAQVVGNPTSLGFSAEGNLNSPLFANDCHLFDKFPDIVVAHFTLGKPLSALAGSSSSPSL